MERLLEARLRAWAQRSSRKPLLLDGARQVGKSYLLSERFSKGFAQTHCFDLLANPSLHSAFAEDLEPAAILSNLELLSGKNIDPNKDLIIFDEVGECQKALLSLKFFAEKMARSYICATGSNLGLLQGFPVGKTEMLNLLPMNFEEFIMATGEEGLLATFRDRVQSSAAHARLWPLLLDYYFVGGMPEAVAAWFAGAQMPILERTAAVRQIHQNLLRGYERDFGKYAGRLDVVNITRIFANIPAQLQQSGLDGSVQRYRFKGIVANRSRYTQLASMIDLLEHLHLVAKCYPVKGKPQPPLNALKKDNIFKLFLFDVGLLGCMLDMSYKDQVDQRLAFKGFFAENFVNNELRAAGSYPAYSWLGQSSEIEFLHRTEAGDILPVEVKSGTRTRARSLRAYRAKYCPERTLKLIGGIDTDKRTAPRDMVWPLYHAGHLAQL